MRAFPASPAPIAGVPITPSAANDADRVTPHRVSGWSEARSYTVSPVPPSIVTIKSPLGCTASPDTAAPPRVISHNSRVVRADVTLEGAGCADGVPPYATALSWASMAIWSIPAGTAPTEAPASNVDVPVWNPPFCGSFNARTTSKAQLGLVALHPSERAAP